MGTNFDVKCLISVTENVLNYFVFKIEMLKCCEIKLPICPPLNCRNSGSSNNYSNSFINYTRDLTFDNLTTS